MIQKMLPRSVCVAPASAFGFGHPAVWELQVSPGWSSLWPNHAELYDHHLHAGTAREAVLPAARLQPLQTPALAVIAQSLILG